MKTIIACMLALAAQVASAEAPHVVVVGGDAEYGSRTTTAKIAERLKEDFGFRTTLIHSHVGALEGRNNDDKSIPGLDAINDADLLIIYIRMRTPPQEQLDLLHDYFESGKPAIGMRTTTHAFTNDRGWCPRYFGGHYWSHFGDGIELYALPQQDSHPILRGVPRHASQNANGVYMTNPLGESATPLVIAKRSDDSPAETYAWVNEYKPGSRQFFFTAGHPEEFDEPHNAQLLYNAIFWCLEREVPEQGVLASASDAARMIAESSSQIPAPPAAEPPSDAQVLFGGDDLSAWDWWFGGKEPRTFELDGRAHSGEGLPEFSGARWQVDNGAAVATVGVGDIVSRQEFTDYQLHLDFLTPTLPEDVQRIWRGNSGVYLNGRYEIQILDSSEDDALDELSCGAIAGRRAPDSNACKPAGVWQSFDIYFRAARYRRGRLQTPARVTVVLNGQTIHDNIAIEGPTEWGFPQRVVSGALAGPIRLESDTGPVRFANIWVRPMDRSEVAERLPHQRELTGRPWVDMNYGPFLSASIEVRPGNIANKGIAVRVDEGPGGVAAGEEFLLFETDTLRYAGGWVGPECIDWRSVAFNGEHESHPSVVGHLLFSNPEGPGWAEPDSGDFADTRLKGRDGRHYGPLEKSWGEWRGLYRHGDQVVLSYRIGDAEILEMPGSAAETALPTLTRTFHVGPRSEELVLQVAHDAAGSATVHTSSATPSDQLVSFLSPDERDDRSRRNEEHQDEDEEEAEDEDGDDEWDEDEEEDEDDDDFEEELADDSERFLFSEESIVVADSDAFEMHNADYTVCARIRTEENGSIFSKAPREGAWAENGKSLFVEDGRLAFDIGWVGTVHSEREVADGKWHDVAVRFDSEEGVVQLFVDGKPDSDAELAPFDSVEDHVVRIGFTSPDFPDQGRAFQGYIDHVGFYRRALSDQEIGDVAKGKKSKKGLVAWWREFDHEEDVLVDSVGGHDGRLEDVEIWDIEGEDDFDEEEVENRFAGGLSRPWDVAAYTICWVKGDVDALAWRIDDGTNVRLTIPPGDKPLKFVVSYAKAHDLNELDERRAELTSAVSVVDLQPLCTGGEPKWKKPMTTSIGPLGATDAAMVVDDLTLPLENPYRSWMRLGGFDFFADRSRAAVCTWQGDVWLVDGLDQIDGDLKWRRIAAGMFQPLGLKIVDEDIYVTCRDQLTVLRDLNGDQEIDFYENFNNDAQVTEHFHEFATGLETDKEGNFYYCKCARHARDAIVPQHGTLLKVSKDGESTEIVANGFRAPNGILVNDDGTFFLSDQEGHWIPKNRINLIRPGGFYGNLMGYHEGKTPSDVLPPVTWLHNNFDRSPAEQVRVTSENWGPLEGRLLNLSYGTGHVHLVFEQAAGDQLQGGAVRLPIPELPTGVMRGRFNPADNHLYACGLFGWSSNKTAPGGFYRIRTTGRPLNLPVELHAQPDGITLAFSDPLDREAAENPRNYSLACWNYRATSDYGSEEYRVSNRRRRGRDRLRVTSAKLSDDGRTLELTVARMSPAMQMELQYRIQSADGVALTHRIQHTVHQLGEE